MTNIVQEMTNKIIAALEDIQSGKTVVSPWSRPWKGGHSGMPINGVTRRPYHGGNILMLWLTGYADNRWYTYKQAVAAKMPVRKGQKGTHIIFWQPFKKVKDGKEETGVFMRTYVVFNYEQLTHDDETEVRQEPTDTVDVSFVENLNLIGGLEHMGDKACYQPMTDRIQMPAKALFKSEHHYAATLAHECAHATGAAHRLNREFGKRFGDSAYAIEELVAEMTAAFVCAHLGIASPELQHVEYLASWLKVLQNERNVLMTVAKQAEAAYRMVLRLDDAEEAVSENVEQAA